MAKINLENRQVLSKVKKVSKDRILIYIIITLQLATMGLVLWKLI